MDDGAYPCPQDILIDYFLSNNVLHVVELPPWLQHPLHLRQCPMKYNQCVVVFLINLDLSGFLTFSKNPLDLIVHCAENKGHDDGINGRVCHPRRNQVLSHSL